MLNTLRKGAGTWVAKFFIVVLVLSFAVWGVADIFGGYGQQTVGKVGDVEFSQSDYQQAYQTELRLMSNAVKQQLSQQAAKALGIESRVMTRLVAGAALDSHVKELGLNVSEQAIVDTIHSEPTFQNQDGTFNRLLFDQTLRNAGLSEQGFLISQRESTVRSQLTNLMSKNVAIPKVLIEAWNQYWNAQREVSYFVLPASSAGDIKTPDDQVLKNYYEANKNAFTAPEYRKLSILLVDPELIGKQIEISDADLKANYDANLDRYQIPEKRTVQQIPFPDKAAAEEASKKIKAGTTFEAIAKDRGLNDADMALGTIAKNELFDKIIADAAFALKKDEVSELVEGNLSTVLLRVTDIRPGLTRTFDEMKKTIRKNMAKEKAADKVLDLYDSIEDDRAGGSTLKEVAAKLKLKYYDAEIDREGKGKDGKEVENLSSNVALTSNAFKSDIDVENDAVELFGGSYAWYEVTNVTPSRTRTFDEARANIEKSWRTAEISRVLSQKSVDLVERGNKGESVEDLAKSAGVKVEKSISFRRNENIKQLPKTAIAVAFTLKKDRFGTTSRRDKQGQVIFKVTKIPTPEALGGPNAQKFIDTITSQLTDDLLAQYVTALQNNYGVTINQQALNYVTGNAPQQR